MHLVITKGVDVANVTYLGRSANAAQRIALLWQMPMCIVEGCSNAPTSKSTTRHRSSSASRRGSRTCTPRAITTTT
jgi:hypothetical protein